MMRFLAALAGLVAVLACCAGATQSSAATLWFGDRVGAAQQVVAVEGLGGDRAMVVAWQRSGAGWRRALGPDESFIGSAGIGARADDSVPWTPAGVFTLPAMFGTAPAPGGALPYRVVGPSDWWDVDSHSPTYNTHQVCAPGACRFNTSVSEQLTAYKYAIVMGVNPTRRPYGGAAYFVHESSGTGSAGCVTLGESDLLGLMRWLRPGAVIAIR